MKYVRGFFVSHISTSQWIPVVHLHILHYNDAIIPRGPVDSPHEGTVMRKMFPFDDVISHQSSHSGRASRITLKVYGFHNPYRNTSIHEQYALLLGWLHMYFPQPGSHCWGYYSSRRALLDQEKIIADHDDVIKWKHFTRYWPFGRKNHQSPPVAQIFDVFFDLRINKRLSKQSRRRWIETRSLWRHWNVFRMKFILFADSFSCLAFVVGFGVRQGVDLWSAVSLIFGRPLCGIAGQWTAFWQVCIMN